MAKKIKSALSKIWDVCESMGRAQAASRLSNMGQHEAAKNLILNCHKKN